MSDLRIWNVVRTAAEIRKHLRTSFFGAELRPYIPIPQTSTSTVAAVAKPTPAATTAGSGSSGGGGGSSSDAKSASPPSAPAKAGRPAGLVASFSFVGSMIENCTRTYPGSAYFKDPVFSRCEPAHKRGVPAHKIAFLMGVSQTAASKRLSAGSPVRNAFAANSELYEPHLLGEIFSFLDPVLSSTPTIPDLKPGEETALDLIGNSPFIGESASFGLVNSSYTSEFSCLFCLGFCVSRSCFTELVVGVLCGCVSVECWVYLNTIYNSGDQGLIAVGEGEGLNVNRGLHLIIRQHRAYHGHYGSDTGATTNVPVKEWFHLAFVFRCPADDSGSGGTLLIYQNGVEVGKSTGHPGLQQSCPLWIGAYGGANKLRGAMRHIRFWKRAFSADDVKAVMHRLVAPQPIVFGESSASGSGSGGATDKKSDVKTGAAAAAAEFDVEHERKAGGLTAYFPLNSGSSGDLVSGRDPFAEQNNRLRWKAAPIIGSPLSAAAGSGLDSKLASKK